MLSGVGPTTRLNKWRLVPLHLIGAVLFVCVFVATAHATDTTVQTIVNSGTLNPALTLTSPTDPISVTAMPLTLEGSVSSLTQIRVYVDDVFSVTIPLDEGATTFKYDLVVPPGMPAVKLVGISPFANISPTVTISVTYTLAPATSGGSTSQSMPTANSPQGGAIISHDETDSGTTTYVPPTYASALPGWFYSGLLALDIARPDDTEGKELVKTVQRIGLASTGLFFFAFARPALSLYRRVRYTWLGFSKRPLPRFMRNRPLLFIRTLGALLISGVFWFI